MLIDDDFGFDFNDDDYEENDDNAEVVGMPYIPDISEIPPEFLNLEPSCIDNPEFNKHINPAIKTNGKFDPAKLFQLFNAADDAADDEDYQNLINNPYSDTKLIFLTFCHIYYESNKEYHRRYSLEVSDIAKYNMIKVDSGFYDVSSTGYGGGDLYCAKLTHQQVLELYKKYTIDKEVCDDDGDEVFIKNVFEYNGWMYDEYNKSDTQESIHEIEDAVEKYK